MPNINIDGKDYDFDTLPQSAKEQLQSLQFVDTELKRLQAQAAIYQTARIAYVNALQQALAQVTQAPTLPGGDTLKLS